MSALGKPLRIGIYPDSVNMRPNCPQLPPCQESRHCIRFFPFKRIICLVVEKSHIPVDWIVLNETTDSLQELHSERIDVSELVSTLTPTMAAKLKATAHLAEIEWGFLVASTIGKPIYDTNSMLKTFSQELWLVLLSTVITILTMLLFISLWKPNPTATSLSILLGRIIWMIPSKKFPPSELIKYRSTKIVLLLYGYLLLLFVPLFRGQLVKELLVVHEQFPFNSGSELAQLIAENKMTLALPERLAHFDYYEQIERSNISPFRELRLALKLNPPEFIREDKLKSFIGKMANDETYQKYALMSVQRAVESLTFQMSGMCRLHFIADTDSPTYSQSFLFRRNSSTLVNSYYMRFNRAILQYQMAIRFTIDRSSHHSARLKCQALKSSSSSTLSLEQLRRTFVSVASAMLVSLIIYLMEWIYRLMNLQLKMKKPYCKIDLELLRSPKTEMKIMRLREHLRSMRIHLERKNDLDERFNDQRLMVSPGQLCHLHDICTASGQTEATTAYMKIADEIKRLETIIAESHGNLVSDQYDVTRL